MISFIGAGKVGSALGLYFKQKGLSIGGYFSRTYERAHIVSKLTNSKVFASMSDVLMNSSMIWITVSDDALESVAKEISELEIPSHINAFIHTSGVHSQKILKSIDDKGFATYCAHPLMAFVDAKESARQLNEVYFSLETPTKEKLQKDENENDNYLINFFKRTGNKTLQIDTEKKELYHCAAAVLSNYLVTLLNLSYEMFEETGITKATIKKATTPLLESTLKNISENDDMKDALTGPIKRGDRTTIMKHLQALEKFMPNKTTLYKELGKETMEMLQNYRLKDIL